MDRHLRCLLPPVGPEPVVDATKRVVVVVGGVPAALHVAADPPPYASGSDHGWRLVPLLGPLTRREASRANPFTHFGCIEPRRIPDQSTEEGGAIRLRG